jgi:hypothetical protein
MGYGYGLGDDRPTDDAVRVCAFCGAEDDGPYRWSEKTGQWFCDTDTGWFCTDLCDHAAGAYYCERNDGSPDA